MTDRASVYGRQSSGKAKSIKEQLAAGHVAILENGWRHAGDYSDGTSASRHATKKRDDWQRILTDLAAGAFNILILWESSRGDRTLSSWAEFLELCRKHHVHVHVIADDHTYDLSRPRDWKTLASAGVDAAAETDLLSIRVKRGHAGAAADGKPAGGPTPYGYRRSFHPDTGKRIGQAPHEPEKTLVRELFKQVADGHTILGLANDLNRREIPGPAGGVWTPSAIRNIIKNPAYIAARELGGTRFAGTWEPIVTEIEFFSAGQILANPDRRITRPGRQKHLLSYLARCAVCDGYVNHVVDCYRCIAGHVSMPKAAADTIVEKAIVGRLQSPDAAQIFEQDSGGDVARLRDQVVQLRATLGQWRASALKGETSPASLAVVEKGLSEQIEAAEADVKKLLTPMPLRALLEPGADVQARWDRSSTVLRRSYITWLLCDVKVGTGRPGRRPGGVDELEWNLPRLGKSRWRGDDRCWEEL